VLSAPVGRSGFAVFGLQTNFVQNSAATGGAMFVSQSSSVTFEGDNTINSNSAEEGGGIFVDTDGSIRLSGRLCANSNTASGFARVEGGTLVFESLNVNLGLNTPDAVALTVGGTVTYGFFLLFIRYNEVPQCNRPESSEPADQGFGQFRTKPFP
jgi:hypothetical protein